MPSRKVFKPDHGHDYTFVTDHSLLKLTNILQIVAFEQLFEHFHLPGIASSFQQSNLHGHEIVKAGQEVLPDAGVGNIRQDLVGTPVSFLEGIA